MPYKGTQARIEIDDETGEIVNKAYLPGDNSMRIYNFFLNVREKITEILDGLGDNVDVSMGRMTPEEIVETALSVAKEKNGSASADKPKYPDKPRLFHYPGAEKLVWSIYFAHYFTEEERQTNFPGYKFMLMAHIRIDDGTGEVIFAEPIRPVFYEDAIVADES